MLTKLEVIHHIADPCANVELDIECGKACTKLVQAFNTMLQHDDFHYVRFGFTYATCGALRPICDLITSIMAQYAKKNTSWSISLLVYMRTEKRIKVQKLWIIRDSLGAVALSDRHQGFSYLRAYAKTIPQTLMRELDKGLFRDIASFVTHVPLYHEDAPSEPLIPYEGRKWDRQDIELMEVVNTYAETNPKGLFWLHQKADRQWYFGTPDTFDDVWNLYEVRTVRVPEEHQGVEVRVTDHFASRTASGIILDRLVATYVNWWCDDNVTLPELSVRYHRDADKRKAGVYYHTRVVFASQMVTTEIETALGARDTLVVKDLGLIGDERVHGLVVNYVVQGKTSLFVRMTESRLISERTDRLKYGAF